MAPQQKADDAKKVANRKRGRVSECTPTYKDIDIDLTHELFLFFHLDTTRKLGYTTTDSHHALTTHEAGTHSDHITA
jgi:hypothetical protein